MTANIDQSKVMRCSSYGNGDRMLVILNGEPFEEMDCFMYLGSQVEDRELMEDMKGMWCTE